MWKNQAFDAFLKRARLFFLNLFWMAAHGRPPTSYVINILSSCTSFNLQQKKGGLSPAKGVSSRHRHWASTTRRIWPGPYGFDASVRQHSRGVCFLELPLSIKTGAWENPPSKMASPGSIQDLQSVVALIKTLINAQLKDILRSENLQVSGVKSSLQFRIIDRGWSVPLPFPIYDPLWSNSVLEN